MHFVLEDCIVRDPGYDEFVRSINERFQLPHTRIDIRPFSHEFIPDIWADGKLMSNPQGVYFFGSTELIKIAHERYPQGVFFNNKFRFTEMTRHYGPEALNASYILMPLVNLDQSMLPMFVRPDEDLKLFSGGIIEPDEFEKWKEWNLGVSNGPTEDTLIVLAQPRKIGAEFRFFVIDGNVVTGSRYKLKGQMALAEIHQGEPEWEYAQCMADVWRPHDNFVIDIDLTFRPGSDQAVLKVIEINCLNSAGLYACDTNMIVGKLLEWHERNSHE